MRTHSLFISAKFKRIKSMESDIVPSSDLTKEKKVSGSRWKGADREKERESEKAKMRKRRKGKRREREREREREHAWSLKMHTILEWKKEGKNRCTR